MKPAKEILTGCHPWCRECGWRQGGRDSWNGSSCKCGHSGSPVHVYNPGSRTCKNCGHTK